jgi:hypothetical protein
LRPLRLWDIKRQPIESIANIIDSLPLLVLNGRGESIQ